MSRLGPISWAAAAGVLAGMPYVLSLFQTIQLTVFVIFALLALSLDFIWGVAGILSFGQAALFGIGAYAAAIVSAHAGPNLQAITDRVRAATS